MFFSILYHSTSLREGHTSVNSLSLVLPLCRHPLIVIYKRTKPAFISGQGSSFRPSLFKSLVYQKPLGSLLLQKSTLRILTQFKDNSRFLGLIDNQEAAFYVLYLYCLSSALSIALSKITVGLFLVIFLYQSRKKIFTSCLTWQHYLQVSKPLVAPAAAWLLLSLLSSFLGLSISESIKETLKLGLFLCFPLAVGWLFSTLKRDCLIEKLKTCLYLVLASQSLVAIHSLVEIALDGPIWPKLPGPLTESGQNVLLLPFLAAVILNSSYKLKSKLGLTSLALCGLAIISSGVGAPLKWLLLAASTGLALSLVFHRSFSLAGAGLVCAALVVNLKRGPWLGATAALIGFFAMLSRKSYLLAILVFISSLFLVEPIRERAFSLIDHFTISGGRLEMWTLGVELIEKYPLGLGLGNAEIIQSLDTDMPETHRHLHNNILNIAVETGWLGAIVWAWWMFSFIICGPKTVLELLEHKSSSWLQKLKAFFKNKQEIARDAYNEPASLSVRGEMENMIIGLSAAIFGWQVAGMAEFNFGDAEIKLLAYLIMGLILALHFHLKTNQSPDKGAPNENN